MSSSCSRSASCSATVRSWLSACERSAALRDWRTISADRATPATASSDEPISTAGIASGRVPAIREWVAIAIGTANALTPTRNTRIQVIRRWSAERAAANSCMSGCAAAVPSSTIGSTQNASVMLPQT